MSVWISIPILSLLIIVQSVIVSRITLLHGSADLIMLAIVSWALQKQVKSAWIWAIFGGLLVGVVSALPFFIPALSFLVVVAIAVMLKQRVWQVPIFAMFVTTFIGTLVIQLISLIALNISGTPMEILDVLFLITLPSLLLNLLLAAPIYFLFGDLAKWVYPGELTA
jgi:rod shape-determining protein MreD